MAQQFDPGCGNCGVDQQTICVRVVSCAGIDGASFTVTGPNGFSEIVTVEDGYFCFVIEDPTDPLNQGTYSGTIPGGTYHDDFAWSHDWTADGVEGEVTLTTKAGYADCCVMTDCTDANGNYHLLPDPLELTDANGTTPLTFDPVTDKFKGSTTHVGPYANTTLCWEFSPCSTGNGGVLFVRCLRSGVTDCTDTAGSTGTTYVTGSYTCPPTYSGTFTRPAVANCGLGGPTVTIAAP